MTLLTEDQKTQISENVEAFCLKAHLYFTTKNELEKCEQNIRKKTTELSEVAKEERQLENAMEILYVQPKKHSKLAEIETEILKDQAGSKELQNDLNKLRTDLLELMRTLPIPADLENLKQNGDKFFPYFEEAPLNDEAINVILDLLRQNPPLTFDDVTILPDKVVIRSVSEKQEAIQKLVKAIQSFRMRVDNLLKSYEKIDVLVERLVKSKLYADILRGLSEKRKLSVKDLANLLNLDERKVYDGCYNLTRSNWSPNPIEKASTGEWELTLAGEILVNRLSEKYPEENEGNA